MSVLKEICDNKILEVNTLKKKTSKKELLEIIKMQESPRGFRKALNNKVKNNNYGLIAEIKKASPSKGLIKSDFNHVKIAEQYLKGGAACLSILTEEKWFKGNINYLIDVKKYSKLPILRKDFILDPWQIYESRSIGADCILIILAAVDDPLAKELINISNSLGMDVLVETHNEEEVNRAISLKACLIGINNRNLKTLDIDLNNTINLSKLIPDHCDIICESGLNNNNDLKGMEKIGIMRFLVGESLMRSDNIELATKELIKR
ncbi:indole-3-glycerol phosphate synthase TrpC [Alphaproteobacteria bacterium]|nr:indole-3-glycerol phosphate synthase TrpC [Alphaproteobacteria bacterium]